MNNLESTWYIWAFVIFAIVLAIYMPKIKGFIGEKAVAFFLSRLNQEKYKVLNNIMLQHENKTSQIDHIVVSN